MGGFQHAYAVYFDGQPEPDTTFAFEGAAISHARDNVDGGDVEYALVTRLDDGTAVFEYGAPAGAFAQTSSALGPRSRLSPLATRSTSQPAAPAVAPSAAPATATGQRLRNKYAGVIQQIGSALPVGGRHLDALVGVALHDAVEEKADWQWVPPSGESLVDLSARVRVLLDLLDPNRPLPSIAAPGRRSRLSPLARRAHA